MVNNEFGHIEIKLEEVIQTAGLSKNKVANLAQMQRKQLNNYCKGDMQRLDLEILSRLCYALDCSVCDIIEYRKPTEE